MVGATVGLGATVVAVGVIGVTDIAAGAARPLDARPVEVSPLALLLAFTLTTSLCPEHGDDAAVRQIVQANSASPHFVGAAITSAKGKEEGGVL